MPFQQATENRFLQFDIKVTTESGFIMYKNNKPVREPFSRDNHPPAVLIISILRQGAVWYKRFSAG